MFNKVKSLKKNENLVIQVKKLIHQNELSDGDKLPSEQELAELTGMSRNSVREALQKLETLGLVEREVGNGTFVRTLTREKLTEKFSFLNDETKSSFHWLLEARNVVEPEIAKFAAIRIQEKDIGLLEKHLKEMKEAARSGKSILKHDFQFHKKIAEATQNPVLSNMFENIADLLLQWQQLTDGFEQKKSLKHHEEILSCIKNRDGELAKKKSLEHLQLQNHLMKMMMNKK